MKKTLVLVLIVTAILASFAMSVSAATLADVETALEGAGIPAVYISQAVSYFTAHPLSSAEYQLILDAIAECKTIAAGETKLSAMSGAQKSAILEKIAALGTSLGMLVTYEGDVLTVLDSSEQTIFTVTSAAAVKQTGYDYSLVLLGLGLLVAAAGTGVAVSRTRRAQTLRA